MLIKKIERCGTQKSENHTQATPLRNNSSHLSYFKQNPAVLPHRHDSSTTPESLKGTGQTEAKPQPPMCRKMTRRKPTGPRLRSRQRLNMIKQCTRHAWGNRTPCISNKHQTKQEHPNHTSCHEPRPYDVNTARPASIS